MKRAIITEGKQKRKTPRDQVLEKRSLQFSQFNVQQKKLLQEDRQDQPYRDQARSKNALKKAEEVLELLQKNQVTSKNVLNKGKSIREKAEEIFSSLQADLRQQQTMSKSVLNQGKSIREKAEEIFSSLQVDLRQQQTMSKSVLEEGENMLSRIQEDLDNRRKMGQSLIKILQKDKLSYKSSTKSKAVKNLFKNPPQNIVGPNIPVTDQSSQLSSLDRAKRFMQLLLKQEIEETKSKLAAQILVAKGIVAVKPLNEEESLKPILDEDEISLIDEAINNAEMQNINTVGELIHNLDEPAQKFLGDNIIKKLNMLNVGDSFALIGAEEREGEEKREREEQYEETFDFYYNIPMKDEEEKAKESIVQTPDFYKSPATGSAAYKSKTGNKLTAGSQVRMFDHEPSKDNRTPANPRKITNQSLKSLKK